MSIDYDNLTDDEQCTKFLHRRIDEFVTQRDEAVAELEAEKKRRVYYQDIVYQTVGRA